MNYYEHHLGDYAKDTLSLSMLEEGAYRRLIDAYYVKEAPLPPDERKVFKLARAISKAEREAVQAVLEEYFSLQPDGYHHKRCDEEIESYLIGQEGSVHKRESDKERQTRSRERRKALFADLRGHGIVAPWDSKTGDLETMLSRVTKTDLSAPVTPPVTRDNTANQTPDPSPQSPKKSGAKAPLSARLPTCPYDAIAGLYREVLPELPGVVVMDAKRKEAMLEFWKWVLTTARSDGTPRATDAAQALEWTREYMTRARGNDFIMGRGPRSPDHKNWRCSIEFLLSPRGMKKVIEETHAEEATA